MIPRNIVSTLFFHLLTAALVIPVTTFLRAPLRSFATNGRTLEAELQSRIQSSGGGVRKSAAEIVIQIQRADYEGDREALKRLYQDLSPYSDDKAIGAKVNYWRGFAMWRSALNGFNDSVKPGELEQNIRQAASEFQEALNKDPSFVDAKASAGSCIGLLMFLYKKNPTLAPEFNDPARMREQLLKALSYLNEAEAAEPENPRVLWVLGPVRWNLPPERGGGQDKAVETYLKGLKAVSEHRTTVNDPLIPSWGEPELLMSLAYSNLRRTTPDLTAAEQYARSALALVPYWHYVRDILIPQIQEARKKAK
jgi:tetratricopeptide (TPR) repeat protein